MATPAKERRRKPTRTNARPRSGRPRRKTGRSRGTDLKLSPADIAQLADEMRIPEGTLRMVLAHYPELAQPLARRWTGAGMDEAA